jgi:hypothetical protein
MNQAGGRFGVLESCFIAIPPESSLALGFGSDPV